MGEAAMSPERCAKYGKETSWRYEYWEPIPDWVTDEQLKPIIKMAREMRITPAAAFDLWMDVLSMPEG